MRYIEETELTEAERRLAKFLAKRRHDFDVKAGYENKKQSAEEDLVIHERGIAGEIAFCKMMNLYPDLRDDMVQKSHDAVLREASNATVDVKTSAGGSRTLFVLLAKRETPADLYCLLFVEGNYYRIEGWATAGSLFVPENIVDVGHGPCYAVPKERLLPLEEALVTLDIERYEREMAEAAELEGRIVEEERKLQQEVEDDSVDNF
jgi:hypothetical protein